MNRFVRRLLTLGPLMWYLVVSAVGYFVLMRGIWSVAREKGGSETGSSIRAVGRSRKSLTGIGAATFLLVFIASEALAIIGALFR
jgi:hypothetical protein